MPDALVEVVEQAYRQAGWHPQKVEGRPAWRVQFDLPSGPLACQGLTFKHDHFLAVVVAPVPAPEAVRPQVMAFLTRVNLATLVGNFEMDVDGGAIRFKNALTFQHVLASPALIKQATIHAAKMMDRYLPGLRAVIRGTHSPEAAFVLVNGNLP